MARDLQQSSKFNITPWLLLSPAILLISCIIIYPILNVIHTSFYYYTMWDIRNKAFIGFQNYFAALKDIAFLESLKNSLQWVVTSVIVQLLIGLILSLILNKHFFGRGIIRSISLIPWVTPGVLIALMWSWIYNGNYGVLNDILIRAGILSDKVAWLSNPHTALWCQIVSMIWQGIPFFTIMFLASLQTIDLELYAAAEVDGASQTQVFLNITLPHLIPTAIITVLLRIIWVANNVEIIYIMTQGGPAYKSLTLSVYTYMEMQKSLNFGYSATLAIYNTLILIVIMVFYLIGTKRMGGVME